jgi:hypothetical protein
MPKTSSTLACGLAAASFLAPAMAAAVLTPVADARIVAYAQDYTEGSSIHLSVYNYGANIQRTLLQFDLSAMDPDESITSATLRLHADAALHPTGNPSGQSMEVYRLTQPWEELAVSWNSRLSGALWTTPGGDYVGTTGVPGVHPYAANGSVVPDGYASPVELSWNITSLVQEWHSGTYANHGLLLLSYPGNGLVFGSREAGAEGYAIPQLEIQTAVVPEPAEAAALSALGLAAFGLVGRLRRSRGNPRHDVCGSSRCTSAQYQ